MYARHERGSTLMEALVALVLTAILLNGVGFLSTRATATYTDQQLMNIAIEQMRASLRTDDICTTAPTITLPDGSTVTAVAQGCDTMEVTINGHTITDVPTPPGLSVTHAILGGQIVVGGTWRQ